MEPNNPDVIYGIRECDTQATICEIYGVLGCKKELIKKAIREGIENNSIIYYGHVTCSICNKYEAAYELSEGADE